jgi:hypothetical protein
MIDWQNPFQGSRMLARQGALITKFSPPLGRAMMRRDSRNTGQYKVGKKRPPKHTQFKPGQSGNPAGRPKGSSNLKAKLERELRKSVLVEKKNGQSIRMTKADVLARQLVDNSIRGDVRTAAIVVRFTEDISTPTVGTQETAEIPMPDKDALKRISARLLRLAEGED